MDLGSRERNLPPSPRKAPVAPILAQVRALRGRMRHQLLGRRPLSTSGLCLRPSVRPSRDQPLYTHHKIGPHPPRSLPKCLDPPDFGRTHAHNHERCFVTHGIRREFCLTFAQIRPNSRKCGQIPAKFESQWVTFRPKHAQSRPKPGQMRTKEGRISRVGQRGLGARFGPKRPNLVDFGPSWLRPGQYWWRLADFGPALVDVGRERGPASGAKL